MSGDGYLISIIIPVYNGRGRIAGAFDSVLNQTIGFDRLQVILVDDASTDGSGAFIEGLDEKYANVVALHTEKNSGYAGRPRNRGIEMAIAEYLMFLDQDDAYYPDACRLLYEAAESSGDDVVSGYYSKHDGDGNLIAKIAPTYKKFNAFHIATVDDYPDVLKLHSGFWAKIYRRQLIEDKHIRFVEDAPVEDMVFFAEAALGMSGCAYVEQPIVRYTVRDGGGDRSLSFDVGEEAMRAVGRGFDALYRVFERYGREDLIGHIMGGKANYYTKILLRGNYSGMDDAIACIRGLRSVYAGAAKYAPDDTGSSLAASTMTELVSEERYEEAARFLLAARDFSRRVDALEAKNRELKRGNRDLAGALRLADGKYSELQRRLKHSIIIRILNKIRRWRLF